MTHNYDELGDYTINLSITDDLGFTTNTSFNISVILLEASFNSSNDDFIAPNETIYLNDTSVGYYDIVNWSWDFNDGSNLVYSQNTTHKFNSDGIYNITLNVTDNQSNYDTYYKEILVDSMELNYSIKPRHFLNKPMGKARLDIKTVKEKE